MTVALIPLAVFLINETTKEIFVLPPEAARSIEGTKPCAPIKANITATTFSAATLDQMCTSLAQSLLPRVNGVMKTSLSSDHAREMAATIRSLQLAPTLRPNAPVWPPEIPFTLAGLTEPKGMNMVFGVRMNANQAVVLERIDLWSSVNKRFTRTYWSRSMNDPTYSSSLARITMRMGAQVSRAWKSQQAIKQNPDTLNLLVDKKISEREMAIIENVLKAQVKGAAESVISPAEVRKDGIIYRTSAAKSKQSEIVARLSRELPALQTRSLTEGPVDVTIMFGAPQ